MGNLLIKTRSSASYTSLRGLQMAGTHGNGDGRGLIWLRGREAALAGVAADLREDDGLVAESIASIAEIFVGLRRSGWNGAALKSA